MGAHKCLSKPIASVLKNSELASTHVCNGAARSCQPAVAPVILGCLIGFCVSFFHVTLFRIAVEGHAEGTGLGVLIHLHDKHDAFKCAEEEHLPPKVFMVLRSER